MSVDSLNSVGNGDELEPKKSRRKAVLITLFKYGLGFALLAYLIWMNQDGLGKLSQKPLHPLPFLIAMGMMLSALVLTFVRWFLLVRAVDLPFTVFNAIRLGFMGFFLSTFLPGSVGGDIVKAAFIAREQKRRTVAVSTVVIDRGAALWALIWFVALLGAAFWAFGYFAGQSDALQKIVTYAWIIIGVTLAVWISLGFLPEYRAVRFAGRLQKIPRVGGSMVEAWRAVWTYRKRSKRFWFAILLSLIGHIGFVLTFYFAARTLYAADQIPSATAHFMIVPILMVIYAIPITPGGLGVGEAAAGELYRIIGADPEYGFFAALVYRVVIWTVAFLGYLVYIQMRPAQVQATEKPGNSG